MSTAVTHTITFDDPCYLTTTTGPGVVAVLKKGELILEEPLVPHPEFVQVNGILLEITVNQAGKEVTLRPDTTITVGPNAWGIFQPIDDGIIGWSLEITKQDGTTVDVRLAPPKPLGPGSADPTIFPFRNVFIKNGAVYNGLSEGLLNVAVSLIGGGVHETTPVPPGKETGPIPFTAFIQRFEIRFEAGQSRSWFPEQNIGVEDGYPIAVLGDPNEPILAIFKEVGPAQIVTLTKNIPEV
jgi:hypothetical protein